MRSIKYKKRKPTARHATPAYFCRFVLRLPIVFCQCVCVCVCTAAQGKCRIYREIRVFYVYMRLPYYNLNNLFVFVCLCVHWVECIYFNTISSSLYCTAHRHYNIGDNIKLHFYNHIATQQKCVLAVVGRCRVVAAPLVFTNSATCKGQTLAKYF